MKTSQPKVINPRIERTSVRCKICNACMDVYRTTYQVVMHCNCCDKDSPLKDYISQMDEQLERFLENVPTDRM